MTWLETHYTDSSITDWSQATVTEADTYHRARGNTRWDASSNDDQKTIALQRAWDYLCGITTWKANVFDTELPEDIKNAQIVGALAELVTPGTLLPTFTRENYVVKKNIAGVIIKEYDIGGPVQSILTEMRALLKRYMWDVSGINREVIRG